MSRNLTRREFLAGLPGWFPFFWRRGRVTLGGVRWQVLDRGRAGTRYVMIHGNEETARRVLKDHMRQYPGKAYVVTGRARNVPFEGGVLDPNRMFSREGAEKNLRRLNPQWSAARLARALDQLDRLRPQLVEALTPPPGGLLLALHNNSEGYSVTDEVPISDEVSLAAPASPHEFFLATAPEDYAVLRTSPYNAVLQWRRPADDDGSLSRLAARRGVRYVNLEAGLGRFDRQREMLDWAVARLTPDRPHRK